jgi:hypothetical protein
MVRITKLFIPDKYDILLSGKLSESDAGKRLESSSICSVAFIPSIEQAEQADGICGARLSNHCLTVLVEKVERGHIVGVDTLAILQGLRGSVLHIAINNQQRISIFSLYQNSCKKINKNYGILKSSPVREVWDKTTLKNCFDDMSNAIFKVAHPIHIPNYKYSKLGKKNTCK